MGQAVRGGNWLTWVCMLLLDAVVYSHQWALFSQPWHYNATSTFTNHKYLMILFSFERLGKCLPRSEDAAVG